MVGGGVRLGCILVWTYHLPAATYQLVEARFMGAPHARSLSPLYNPQQLEKCGALVEQTLKRADIEQFSRKFKFSSYKKKALYVKINSACPSPKTSESGCCSLRADWQDGPMDFNT